MKEKLRALWSKPFIRKGLVALIVFYAILGIAGFFIAPSYVKTALLDRLSAELGRPVSIEKVSINPYTLSVDAGPVVITERGGQAVFLSFETLHVNAELISIIKGGPVLSEIRLEKPFLNIVRNFDGTYNFSDLLEKQAASTRPDQKQEKKTVFSLNNIQILNGSIDFFDGPKHIQHSVRDLKLMIPFLSTVAYDTETFVEPLLEATVNGTKFSFQGKTKLFANSLETHFDINIAGFNLANYLAYVPYKLDFVLKSGLIDSAAKLTYTQYSDRPPSINLAGSIDLRTIALEDLQQRPILRLPHVALAIAKSDLMGKSIHFTSIAQYSPEMYLRRDAAGNVNWHAFLTRAMQESAKETAAGAPKTKQKQEKEKPKAKETPAVVDIDSFTIKDGIVSWQDVVNGQQFSTTLSAIQVQIAGLSTKPEKKAQVTTSFRTEAEEQVAVSTLLQMEPLFAEGSFSIQQAKLKKYQPYLREATLVQIQDGSLDLWSRFSYSQAEPESLIRLWDIESSLKSFKARKQGEKRDFIDLPAVAVKGTQVDLPKREIVLGEIAAAHGLLNITREPDGTINLLSLIPEKKADETSPPAQDATAAPKASAKPQEKPWLITVKKIDASDYAVKLEDLQPSEPVTLRVDKIRFSGENISTLKNTKGKVSLQSTVGKKGTVSLDGPVSLEPLTAQLRTDVRSIDLAVFRAYTADQYKVIMTGGRFTTNGMFVIANPKDGMKIRYQGKVNIAKFSSIDKANAEDFVKFDSLTLNSLDISTNPMRVLIKQIALNDFYSRIIINPDGTLNTQGLSEQAAASPGADAQPAVAPRASPAADKKDEAPDLQVLKKQKLVKIDELMVQGGTIHFSDRNIKPNYTARMLEIGGRVSGMTSEEEKFADVELRGVLEGGSPFEITGKINPLRDDLYIALKVDLQNMDLSTTSPYAGRYLGYTIQKGKMGMDLEYLIENKKLDAKNTITFDQLTLGESVESHDATKMPVKLAIALLKNRSGEIHLDLPVTGTTDDPEFRVGKIIWKIILNVLVKAATSPFALLGAIVGGGGGEEMSYIDFAYGTATLTEQEQKKIDKLMTVLHERPALRIDIEGHADLLNDREGLKQELMQRKVRAQKLRDMAKSDKSVNPENVVVTKEEYPNYLKQAYKAEKFPKPSNFLGIAKDIPVSEMEKLMLTHAVVNEDMLRELAKQRARTVYEYILKTKRVEKERIFLVEPKAIQPEKKEKVRDSRVDFKLK